jgi:hypothetical protein
VTASDVVATWVLKMDKGLQDPSNQMTFGKFEKPVAESKYILSVKTKVLNWRNFLYFRRDVDLPGSRTSSTSTAPPTSRTTTSSSCPDPVPTRSRNRTSSRARVCRSAAAPTTGPRRYRATSGCTTSTNCGRLSFRDPEAGVRDVQEGRPRRLLLQRPRACGSRR